MEVITFSLQFHISLQYEVKGLWLFLSGLGIKAFCCGFVFFFLNLMRNIEKLSEIFQLEIFCFTAVLHVDVCQL